MRKQILLFLLLVNVSVLEAQMSLAHYFSDGMVLQHGKVNLLYGNAPAGAAVTITYKGKKTVVYANNKEEWRFALPPGKPGKAGEIVFSSGLERIVLNDVLFGDVWVCSGQSNMEFQMSSFRDTYGEEMATAQNNHIRFVIIEKRFDNQEWQSPPIGKSWRSVTPNSIPECSAVAYFFAKKLQQKLKIPIGLIISAWGGTPAQSWMDTTSLKAFPGYYNTYQHHIQPINFAQIAQLKKQADEAFRSIKRSVGPSVTGMAAVAYNDAAWEKSALPGVWEERGHPNLDGIAMYRTRFMLPPGMENKTGELYLPAVDDIDSTYINGVFVGSHNIWNEPRKYTIPANLLKAGENVLSVWVEDGQGGGGMNNEPNGFYLKIGDEKVNLSGPAAFQILAPIKNAAGGANVSAMQNEPGVLYNAMIAPLLKTAIKGAIWYQGESNVPKYDEYRTLFPALIKGWRNKWKQGNFPFLFVQLSSYNPSGVEPALSDWALLREAQAMALQLPNTGMAVTTDVGDEKDIHPKRKKEVGERLAAQAFYRVYGMKKDVYTGPVYASHTIKGKTIEIAFEHTGTGLTAGNNMVQGFAVAGADKKFYPAMAEIMGNRVAVMCADVPAPVYVRYAWGNAPLNANVYNREGFPAAPFRTDKD